MREWVVGTRNWLWKSRCWYFILRHIKFPLPSSTFFMRILWMREATLNIVRSNNNGRWRVGHSGILKILENRYINITKEHPRLTLWLFFYIISIIASQYIEARRWDGFFSAHDEDLIELANFSWFYDKLNPDVNYVEWKALN